MMTKNYRPKHIWQALQIQILLRKDMFVKEIFRGGYNIVNVTSLFCKIVVIDVLAGNLSFRINCKSKTATMILIFEPRMTHTIFKFFPFDYDI